MKKKLSCEGNITEEECVKALQSFRVTKLLVMMGFQSNFTVNFGKLLANLSSTVSTRFLLVVKCHASRNRL